MMDSKLSIKRLKAIQPATNACITIFDEPMQAMKDGPLSTWSVAVKDNISIKGELTTAGTAILANYRPPFHATVIQRLLDQGVSMVAKTALDELGMGGSGLNSFHGIVRNPLNLDYQAGGSSSGSAAIMAAKAVDMALGTDTGDSVRKPASFCGIVGIKPTYGRISRYGVIPYASSLDHVGYFTHNVKDGAIALEAMAGYDPKDPTSIAQPLEAFSHLLSDDLKGKHIGIFKNVVDHIHDERTKALLHQLIEKIETAGGNVSWISLDETLLKAMLPTYYVLANGEASSNHANLNGLHFGVQQAGDDITEIMEHSRTKGFSRAVRKRMVMGGYGLLQAHQEAIYFKALKIRRLLVEALDQALEDVDVLVAPATSSKAFLINGESNDPLSLNHLISENFMVLGNFSGYPSMTIPMGNIDDLPIGINITAKAFDEKGMFMIAHALEQLIDYQAVQEVV